MHVLGKKRIVLGDIFVLRFVFILISYSTLLYSAQVYFDPGGMSVHGRTVCLVILRTGVRSALQFLFRMGRKMSRKLV